MSVLRLNMIVIFLMLLISGCKKVRVSEKEIQGIAPFNEILLDDSFDVYLSEGSTYSVKIEADESVIDFVSFDVSDSLLTINNLKKFKWLTPTKNKIKIFITSPPLKTVLANETCFIRTLTPITSMEFGMVFLGKANNAELDLNCDVFYYWNSYPCGGTLTLQGNCNWLKIWNVALVDVQASELNASNAEISNNSKGDCVINVSEYFKYTIPGEGNIELYGRPVDIVEYEPSTGTGELIIH